MTICTMSRQHGVGPSMKAEIILVYYYTHSTLHSSILVIIVEIRVGKNFQDNVSPRNDYSVFIRGGIGRRCLCSCIWWLCYTERTSPSNIKISGSWTVL